MGYLHTTERESSVIYGADVEVVDLSTRRPGPEPEQAASSPRNQEFLRQCRAESQLGYLKQGKNAAANVLKFLFSKRM